MAHAIDRTELKARLRDVWGHLTAEELREQRDEAREAIRLYAGPEYSVVLEVEAELFEELAAEKENQ